MNCSSEVAAQRAQSWLYFGLLHEIFGPEYTQEKFLRPNPSGLGFLVDTRELPDLLSRLSRLKYHDWAWIFDFNKAKDLEFVNRCRPICVEVNLQSDLLDRCYADCRTITLSIKILLQSVQTAICNLEQNESQCLIQFFQQDSLTTEWLRQAGAGNRPPTFTLTPSLGHIISQLYHEKVLVPAMKSATLRIVLLTMWMRNSMWWATQMNIVNVICMNCTSRKYRRLYK